VVKLEAGKKGAVKVEEEAKNREDSLSSQINDL
jgi:hypothetical protein